eukprot:SM000176S03140  [mRNA]  locus=s176:278542:282698:+ [translate_table: standard]
MEATAAAAATRLPFHHREGLGSTANRPAISHRPPTRTMAMNRPSQPQLLRHQAPKQSLRRCRQLSFGGAFNLMGQPLELNPPRCAHGRCVRRKAHSFAVSAVAVTPATSETAFDAMVAGTKRKYYMVGGKGGVGKTSLSASLAVRFANSGHPTLVVSTDPAHSLSDSFAQNLTGGKPIPVEGTDLPLFAMEINPEQAREEFRGATAKDGGKGVKDVMDSLGLGGWVDQASHACCAAPAISSGADCCFVTLLSSIVLGCATKLWDALILSAVNVTEQAVNLLQLTELKLGELLDTPPPGLDEAVAISKVVQFMQSPEYDHFTRIIFDTAPTGHTLRLLSLPDFLDASIGKLLRLKQKLSSATAAIKSVFGQGGDGKDGAAEKLERLKARMVMVRDIFRDKENTEFVIVTIPTVMAISESSRLRQSLQKEGVPVKRLIVNQLLPASASAPDCKFCAIKRKDQKKAIDSLKTDPGLQDLTVVESPLFDMEIRGIPALKFMGDLVWQ